ncbi:MAG: DNA repair protein RecN [Clostridiales bacterium]|nr:DNA repair protein RecN [Clostridiales bacterium]
MLRTLKIKNFALIAEQTIDFSEGFNVLVGETGAGKSLILDALSFVLGDKANKLNLRNGESKLMVQAIFDDSMPEIDTLLEDSGIEVDESLIITRTQNVDGKTESRINGTIVPASIVKTLASYMVDTCGQNENIQLLKIKNHLSILDSYAAVNVLESKNKINELLQQYKNIKQQMADFGGNRQNRERELELLSYQINDIETANLYLGEDDELKNKISVLVNYEKIFDSLKNAQSEFDTIENGVNIVESALSVAARFNSEVKELNDRLNSVKIDLYDIAESVNSVLSNSDFDQSELDVLMAREDEIKSLKKKYGATIEEILLYLTKIKNDYDNLLFGEEKLIKLSEEYEKIGFCLYQESQNLSNIRREVAKKVEIEVIKELKLLGFKNAIFKVDFKPLPEKELALFTKDGLDEIEFLLSANAGEGLKSLSKTISGGEMSRFMLAIKNVFARCFKTSTLVFDEVDTGISGEIGQKVAERLAVLSKSCQLICITHLCQVAAMADNYIYVSKEVVSDKTFTKISYLQDNEIIKYLAISSGAQPTEVAMQFAEELKTKANAFKVN